MSAPPNNSSRRRDQNPANVAKKELEKLMENLAINAGTDEGLEKEAMPAGDGNCADKPIGITTNLYPVSTTSKKPIKMYRMDFFKIVQSRIEGQPPRECPLMVDLEKMGMRYPDFTAAENRKIRGCLFDAFVEKYPRVFGDNVDELCYDFGESLYSLHPLFPPSGKNDRMELSVEEVQKAAQRPYAVRLVLKATPMDFSIAYFASAFAPNASDRSTVAIRFLEIATSRYCATHPSQFLMYEASRTFPLNPAMVGGQTMELSSGKYLAPGTAKNVDCIEGLSGSGEAVAVIESRKTPFYHTANLLGIIQRAVPANASPELFLSVADKYVKRLQCYPLYGNRQLIPITLSRMSNLDAYGNFVDLPDDRRIQVYDYFNEKYGIRLAQPRLPLVLGAKKVNGTRPAFPLELLYVADNQRVPNSNISSMDVATIVRACAVVPSEKRIEIQRCHESFHFQHDAFLHAAECQVAREPIATDARVIAAPQIQYRNVQASVASNGQWRLPASAKYIRNGVSGQWGAVLLKFGNDRCTLPTFLKFVHRFEEECVRRGVVMNPLNNRDVWETVANAGSIQQAIEQSAEMGLRFLLIGHPEPEKEQHSYIKYLERKHQVITQCVTTKTISNVVDKGSKLTMENIVAKTNVKCGGHNYNVALQSYNLGDDILFIGIASNNPADNLSSLPSDHPGAVSILGFAANDGIMPNEFIGNFFLQPPNATQRIHVLVEIVKEAMERFKANRKRKPSAVVFFRDGVDEGSFRKILVHEVPILTRSVQTHAPGAGVTVVVPSKSHGVRFFKQHIEQSDRAPAQNIPPGLVIDHTVVGKLRPEFYLNSHSAIQGTAKTPKYTVLFNSNAKLTLDTLQRWTNALASAFQIVTSATSIPAPLYVAFRYAERGRQIFNHADISAEYAIPPNGSPRPGQEGESSGGSSEVGAAITNDYIDESKSMNFSDRPFLRGKRVNA